MTQHDQSPDTDLRPPNQTRRGLRWTVRLLFMACGLMMGVVLLSQPRVLSQVQASADRIVDILSPRDSATAEVAAADQLPSPEPVEKLGIGAAGQTIPEVSGDRVKPAASVMPGNRVPVRRAGVLNGN